MCRTATASMGLRDLLSVSVRFIFFDRKRGKVTRPANLFGFPFSGAVPAGPPGSPVGDPLLRLVDARPPPLRSCPRPPHHALPAAGWLSRILSHIISQIWGTRDAISIQPKGIIGFLLNLDSSFRLLYISSRAGTCLKIKTNLFYLLFLVKHELDRQRPTSVAFDSSIIIRPVGESMKTNGTFCCCTCCTHSQSGPGSRRELCDGKGIRSGLW